jgi:plasmid stability protein
MASLSVRKLDDNIYTRLKIRAAKHHVSMEEEARIIISQAVSAPELISEVFDKHFGKDNGVDLGSLSQRDPHDPVDFE